MRLFAASFLLSLLLPVVALAHDGSFVDPAAFLIVEEEDASPSCSGTMLKVTNATLVDNGDGTCSISTGGTATTGWTDDGASVSLTTDTDNVSIGTDTAGGKLFIDGDTDEIQLQVQGNAAQTSNLAVFEDSSGTDLFTLSGTGLVTANANLNILNAATSAGVLKIFEDTDDGAHSTSFTVPALAGDVAYTLPPDDGDSGEVLQTNGTGTLTWETASSATAWSSIGDAAADASIGFGSTEQDIVGSLDSNGKAMLTIQNQDTDQANQTRILSLQHYDDTDAQVRYLEMVDDAEATPGVDFYFDQNTSIGGAIMQMGWAGLTIQSLGDGEIEFKGLGNGSDECLSLNLDDTSGTVVWDNCATSTSVSIMNINGMTLDLDAGALTWFDLSSTATGTPSLTVSPGSNLVLMDSGSSDDIQIRADANSLYIDGTSATGGSGFGGTFGNAPAALLVFDIPAAQTIAAGNTVAANACASLKIVTSAGDVTTDTTNTFTAPAATNEGCMMDVCNSGSFTITLDNNANFVSNGAADVALGPNDCVRVGTSGASGVWYQTAPISVN